MNRSRLVLFGGKIVFSLETIIMVSAIVFCIGGLLGAIISRTLIPPATQKGLEVQLQSAREELQQYQQDVAQHFAETSKLVNNLTQSYREVHEHLAKGAIQLTNPEISRQILQAGDGKLGIEMQDVFNDVDFQPPKDWAPKTPGMAGTLSEEFGLNDETEEQPTELDLSATRKRAS